ncbi:AraC family transcriptional regulator [Pseudoalteromonas luteoviolacea]|uniref:HTH araC/xylS-type domain-containing protein n=1 Tax=Pseudoalteromonas luteoviolacea S4054 TaxID=1129367 RepID=A0A0F6AF23_9GAMM|nr:AraC family transcriptional regulator [Pseudoalteromonas luteoviolacea]AOT08053.1 hypothetical protein S4054249_09430 [Pseudoalteromonas luteoviolacea]AOT12970.1 hypothetical protein S40542_09430 [Pseudoalteromonas luteoviolacea]AOT17882.1 hypothetical protein S4054_09425 [Pseudoalteromonas luteoviolacea]KKE84396.1 hypothetical protein N479_09140 [Pseudoalteromonas luteoviolacea S4054]KZN71771.1 hypothetical protein N481_17680 [Pseudoalteromonas luteoviolacea S4047-1]
MFNHLSSLSSAQIPNAGNSLIGGDALSDILNALRLQASSYFCTDFSTPWGIKEQETDYGTFHFVVRGSAWLNMLDSKHATYLSTGDIVAFPTGAAHQIGDQPNGVCISGDELLTQIQNDENPFSEGESITTLLCGYFKYQQHVQLPILRDMPSFLHIKTNEEPSLLWLNNLANMLAHESRSTLPGGTVIVDRLTEVLVIQLLRWHVNTQHSGTGYFRALADTRLSLALSLIHKQPAQAWTVERMAHSVGMSRSAFANLFHEIIGMTPLSYLSQWRMHIAQDLLKEGKESMISVAEQVGYRSEASFSKAFKKIIGISPGQLRRQKK